MAKNNARQLPRFESLDKLVAFFDSQDLGEYLEQMPEVDFEVDIERKMHLVALDAELAEKLTKIAGSKKTSSEALVNDWVREKILNEA